MFYIASYVLSIILLAIVVGIVSLVMVGIMVLLEEKFGYCITDATVWIFGPTLCLTLLAVVYQDTIRDRIGLWPSPVGFVNAYHDDPQQALEAYFGSPPNVNRSIWASYIDDIPEGSLCHNYDYVTTVSENDDVTDAHHVFALYYRDEEGKKFKLILQSDKSLGHFSAWGFLLEKLLDDEIRAIEDSGWKFEK